MSLSRVGIFSAGEERKTSSCPTSEQAAGSPWRKPESKSLPLVVEPGMLGQIAAEDGLLPVAGEGGGFRGRLKMGDDRLQHGGQRPQALVELLLDLADAAAEGGVLLAESVADLDQGGDEGFFEGVDGGRFFAERLELGIELIEFFQDRAGDGLRRGVAAGTPRPRWMRSRGRRPGGRFSWPGRRVFPPAGRRRLASARSSRPAPADWLAPAPRSIGRSGG